MVLSIWINGRYITVRLISHNINILSTTNFVRYYICGGAGDMTPCLMGGTAGVTGEGVRFPDVLSTDDAFGDVGTPKSSLW